MNSLQLHNVQALNRSVDNDTSLDPDPSPRSLVRLTPEVCAQAPLSLFCVLSREFLHPQSEDSEPYARRIGGGGGFCGSWRRKVNKGDALVTHGGCTRTFSRELRQAGRDRFWPDTVVEVSRRGGTVHRLQQQQLSAVSSQVVWLGFA
ncbi:unnamed protein product [Pleuronectes platessa]|uniref:Uncharacterized protein n=1 Tax=Pleuronectes platessa TaxID=8262 RepID=A0A9N7VQ40_PLEPL|nr:unnamed protein product [Pleuronectes platessa]